MISLKRIIALSLCTSMLINGSASAVGATIDNIKALSQEDTDNTNENEKNKNTIIWLSSDSIEVGTEFNIMNGVKAYDEDGSDITNSISVLGNVDNSEPGEYELEYSVENKSGKTIKRTRKVTVKESENRAELSQDTINKDSEVFNKEENIQDITIVGKTFIRTYLGEAFEDKANIQAIDSNGKDITELITVKGKVDVNKVGSYELKYSVADEKGKTATLTRKVNVINKNVFNKYIEKVNEETKEKVKQLGFSIYLDNNTSKFLVENQSKEQLNPSKKDEVVFKIRVIDKNNNEKLKVELLGSDTGDSEKLNALKELEYSFGDYIEINSEDAKETFNIEGKMPGDIKAEIDEKSDITEKDKIEDYSDGVDNMDYLLNVRFRITEEGIKTVYNEAPEIRGLQPMEELLTERSSQLEGVSVIDDHDEDISNDDIKIYEEKDNEGKTIGLRYQVSDSWGRTVSVLRYLNSKSESLDELQDIKYIDSDGNISLASENNTRDSSNKSTTTNLSNNIITVKGFAYSDGTEERFKLKFNSDTKKVEIYDRDSRLFDNKITGKYFEIKLYSKTGTLKKELTINGSDRADAKKIDEFNNITFEFGDQIEIYHAYSENKLLIHGTIQDFTGNAPSNGIPKDKLESARFELTKTGLKYLVNTPPVIEWKTENLIVTRGKTVDLLDDITVTDDIDKNIKKSTVSVTAYNPNKLGQQTVTYSVRDSWGAVGTYNRIITVVSDGALANTDIKIKNAEGNKDIFSIGFDDVEKRLLIKNQTEDKLNEANPNELALSLKIISKVGITKKEIKLNGSANGQNNQITALNGYRYSVGDYIELRSPSYSNSIIITGNILKDDKITGDYAQGVQDEDFIKNVRFKIQEEILYAQYNSAPEFKFKESRTIKRGDKFNPLDFIEELKDDHDNLDIKVVKATYDEDKFETVGNHEVTYRVTDSWGRTTEEKISIEVTEKNDLEKSRIYFLPNTSESSKTDAIITFGFDDVNKRLNADIVENQFISGSLNGIALEISIFNSNGNSKAKSTIRYNNQIDEDSLSNILRSTIEYGDMINIYAYSNNKIIINGLTANEDKYESGFEDKDKMINTRFKVTENGLEPIYNAAPVFHGLTEKTIMKGDSFEKLEGIRVTDDHDRTIDNNQIVVTGEVNTNKAGYYTLVYKVTDSWGRSTEETRRVFVRPLAENNKIILKNSDNQDLFTIGFDFSKMKFTVTDIQEGNNQLNSQNTEKEFSLTVYNSSGKVIENFELNGTSVLNEEAFAKLKSIPLSLGVQISIWAKTSTNLRIEGQLIKPEGFTTDYSNGIQDQEYMNNVRFVGTEDGIKVLHNRAPQVTLSTNNTFVLYKGDNYRQELLKNISVSDIDEFDNGINNDSIEIKLKKVSSNEFITLEQLTDLGEYQAYYIATDSWGRKSQEVVRTINFKTSIGRNEIIFNGYDFKWEGEVFKLKFDDVNKRINVQVINPNKKYHSSGVLNFYQINIYRQDKSLYKTVTLNGNDHGRTPKLNELKNIPFEYGYYINIKAYQAFRVRITGPVRNALDDYSTRVNFSDDFQFTNFEITEAGLESKFVPETMGEHDSLIEFIGTNGGTPFKMKFNHDDKTVTYPKTTEFYNYKDNTNVNALKVIAKKTDRDEENVVIHKGNDSGVKNEFKDIFGGSFNNGDYIRFEYMDIPESFKGVRISGSIYEKNKNYTVNLTSKADIKNVRFYLVSEDDKKYINPVYNYGPEFHGVEDIDIDEEEAKTFDPRANVTLTDDNDEDSTLTYTATANTSSVTNRVGKYVYTYRSTDSWGRETVVTRNVYVRPNLFKNKIVLYPKENISNDEENLEIRSNSGTENTLNEGNDSEVETPSDEEESPTKVKPSFEIVFDNDTNKYVVKNKSNTPINAKLGDNLAFKITIYDESGQERKTIELNGSDTGESTKLDELNRVEFRYGDTIKVWSADTKSLRITGQVGKNIHKENESESTEFEAVNYQDGTDNQDYFKNVAFKTAEAGLIAYYNKAPKINIPNLTDKNELNILFGQEVNLLNGVTVSDDRDQSEEINVEVIGEDLVNTNQIGSYQVTYKLTDTWGRSTSKEVTVNVISNMTNNQIEVYGENANNESEHKFTLKFNIYTNKFEIVRKSPIQEDNSNQEPNISESLNESISEGDLTTLEEPNGTGEEENPENGENSDESIKPQKEKYFQIIVANRKGVEKANIILSRDEMNSDEYLNKLTEINIFNDDIISVYSVNPANVKIKGNIENKGTDNFENGFTSLEQFSNIKFKITNKGFELLKYRELVMEFSRDLSITRGNPEELLRGISLKYKDNSEVESLSNVSVEVTDVDPLEIGEYTAKYTVTDIWGRKIEQTRKVTVVERNALENNRIILKDSSNGNELMEFYIDTIENRIIVRRFANDYEGDVESLIKLTLYDENGRTKDIIEVTKDNLDSIKERYISYDYSDLIGISAYDIKKGLVIKGNIKDRQEDYSNGVDNEDYINNVRFQIIDDEGVKAVYNNAPQINIDGSLILFKDESPELYKGVTVSDSDEHDKNISETDMVIDTELDVTRIGTYIARYILQDTWGRETIVTREIIVKSSLINNKIQFYREENIADDPDEPNNREEEEVVKVNSKESIATDGHNDTDDDGTIGDGDNSDREEETINSLFDISINLDERKFVVIKNNEALKRVRKETSQLLSRTSSGDNTAIIPGQGDVSDDGIDTTRPGVGVVKPDTPIDGVEFEFKLFDENGRIKKKLSITTEDLASRSDINSKLDEFNGTNFEFGDYISIYANRTQNNVRITGNIDKPNHIAEDYSTGISNPDYMYNVRFKINEDAMDAVYNEAPSITLSNPNDVIEVYCGDDIDYGKDVEISDDHDLDIGSGNITLSEEDKNKMSRVGQYTVNLILTDSWGRSVSVERKYNVKASIDKNKVNFGGVYRNEGYTIFTLGFNSQDMQLKIENKSQNPIVHDSAERDEFYKITVYDQGITTVKKQVIISTSDNINNHSQVNELNGLGFKYGDYVQIKAYQAFRLNIQGPVREQLEDYSDGVNLGDDLQYTYFKITEAGLKSEFKPNELADNESLIEFIGTNGGTPFKIKFNHENRSVSFPTDTTEFYNYTDGTQKDVFRVKYYDASARNGAGQLFTYNSRNNDNTVNQQLKNKLSSEGFDTGDYIAFEYLDIPDKYYGLRLTGKIKIDESSDDDLKNEDYSDGIQNKRNLTEVRFYLNKDGQRGIFPVRVPAARITGADDIDILQGTPFNLKEHVEATDTDGTVLTNSMTVTGDNNLIRNIDRNWNLDTSRIGLYYVKYEVINREGIKTTVYRNIRVYTNATLALIDSSQKIVMEQGAYPTEESKKAYLKQFVIAQDPEAVGDNADEINQKLTESIEVDVSNINIEQPGEYNVTYSVINDYQKKVTLDTTVSVVRTINVSVPTTLPFQVVTNLLPNGEDNQDPFVSGVLKLTNNKTSDVSVSIKAFSKEDNSGNLEIVDPNTVTNWDDLSKEESMSKMSLGIFVKSGFKEETNAPDTSIPDGDNDSSGNEIPGNTPEDGDYSDSSLRTNNGALNETNVTWLVPNQTEKTFMGILPRAESLEQPSEARLSFTSKHGKNFIGGTYRGKFRLIFKFE